MTREKILKENLLEIGILMGLFFGTIFMLFDSLGASFLYGICVLIYMIVNVRRHTSDIK